MASLFRLEFLLTAFVVPKALFSSYYLLHVVNLSGVTGVYLILDALHCSVMVVCTNNAIRRDVTP